MATAGEMLRPAAVEADAERWSRCTDREMPPCRGAQFCVNEIIQWLIYMMRLAISPM
jgi:hypothetical protein